MVKGVNVQQPDEPDREQGHEDDAKGRSSEAKDDRPRDEHDGPDGAVVDRVHDDVDRVNSLARPLSRETVRLRRGR